MYASPVPSIDLIRTGRYGKRAAGAGGTKASTNHEAVDMRAAVGTPVAAAIGGTVVQTITGWRSSKAPGTSRGRAIFARGMGGNQVVVRGDDGLDHNYAHLSSVGVEVGDRVETGQVIAKSGRSGIIEPHLHYGTWREVSPNKWVSVDPTMKLPWVGDKLNEYSKIKPKAPATPAEPTKPAAPAAPIPEDDMDKTRLYRNSRGDVALINPERGLLWHVPNRGILGYVTGPLAEALGLENTDQVSLPDDHYRLLCQITAQGHDAGMRSAYVARAYGTQPATTDQA